MEKFIPLLTKDESSKQGALIAISVLASPKIATRMAELYGGQGSINALTTFATSGSTAPGAALTALTNIATKETAGRLGPAHVALGQVFAGKENAMAKLLLSGFSSARYAGFCNGFVVDGSRGWVVTAGYCVENVIIGDVSIQLDEGAPLAVSRIVLSPNHLLGFLKIEKTDVGFKLRTSPLLQGDTITQIEFDFSKGQLIVNLGRVVQSGVLPFASGKGATQARGVIVTLSGDSSAKQGAGGSPLLDAEGNAACMTYQGGLKGPNAEQCVAASAIFDAMKTL